ncbi:MAG: NAD(+) synthase [Bacteroidales bacterium]|nr:NAD(+) synthase [Bacteroidales bacterium]
MILEPGISIAEVYDILISKIRGYFSGAGMTKAVLGLSGGVDSALVATLAADALGAENVHGIMMPSGFSTGHSVSDSEQLAANLGISSEIIPIGSIYDSAMASMEHFFADGRWDTTQENLQARIRALILMAYSNRFNALVLNTSNKSELSTGYGTLYGDLAGAIMVIADLYKLQVYELCRYLNRDGERIPEHILTKAPSAELKPGQKDSDSLPEYEVLDRVLHMLNEEELSEDQVLESFEDKEAARRAIGLRRKSSFKVMQIPPVLTIGSHPLVPPFKCL